MLARTPESSGIARYKRCRARPD